MEENLLLMRHDHRGIWKDGISGRWKDQLWNEGRTIHCVRKETRKYGKI